MRKKPFLTSLWMTLILMVSLASGPTPTPVLASMSLPSGFVSEVVVSGIPSPTTIAWAQDGRMFIGQKDGRVRVVLNATTQSPTLLATNFISITDQVNGYWDRGLLGITLHPDFPNTPYVYLLYTYDPPGTAADGSGGRVSRLSRVTADAAQNYNVAVPGSTVVLLGTNSTLANIGDVNDGTNTAKTSCTVGGVPSGAPIRDCIPSDGASHSIGTVTFGPDGSLFAGTGDASNFSTLDPRALRSQNLGSLDGKIMRIDPTTGNGFADNPFYDGDPTSNRSKVWDYGLRNPFRFTVKPGSNNEVYIGDVGWNTWEEVNAGRGKNFGWPCYEGGSATSLQQPSYASLATCTALYAQGINAVQASVYGYDHSDGGASVQAGAFYSGTVYPAQYVGALFISDYSRDFINYLTFDVNGNATVNNFGNDMSPGGGPVQVIAGPDTNLYYVVYNGTTASEVRRLRYTAGGNTPPTAKASASPSNGSSPLLVNFSSVGSYDPDAQPLTYFWNFGTGVTSTLASPVYTYTIPGAYTATLTVTDPLTATGASNVIVTVGNNAPTATITSPISGTMYNVADTINFSGTGADIEDGTLPGSSLEWEVLLHHNAHVHFDYYHFTGAGGSFVVPDHGDGTWIELCLTATDNGPNPLSDRTCTFLLPNTAAYAFRSVPSGLQLAYQGVGYTTPFTVTTIVSSTQDLIAAPIQASRSFSLWSDGGAASHQIVILPTPQIITATYVNNTPTAVLTGTPTSGIAPVNVAFTSTASDAEGDPLTYLLNFGDGVTSTITNTSHLYATPGVYTATLTVTDTLGAAGTGSVTISAPNNAPVALASAAPISGIAPLNVAFTGTASYDPEGGALNYRWRFGDGATSTISSPAHLFSTPGIYTATLTVTDTLGASGVTTLTISAPNNPPTAVISAAPTAGEIPLTVAFTGTASSDPEGGALTYLWNFGDGITSTLASPAHLYQTPGIYTVTLTVRDPLGTTGSANVQINAGEYRVWLPLVFRQP